MRMNVEKKLDTVRQANEFLAKQIATVKAEIDTAQETLNKYGENKDIISTADASNVTMVKLNQLNADFTAAQNDRILKMAGYESIVHGSPETIASNDALVSQLNSEVAAAEREYAQKRSLYLPEHPDMIALKTRIEKTRQSKQNAVLQAYAQRRDAARSDMLSAESREGQMRTAYEQQKREAMKFNANAATWTDLRAQIEGKRTLLDQLTKRLNETEVTSRLRGVNSSNIYWVDHAELGSPFNVMMKRNLQSAFPLGVILGLAAIFFLEYMDRSIKTPEELERVTKFASLGVIPAAGSVGSRGYYSAGYGRTTPKLRAVDAPVDPQTGIDLLPHVDTRSPISEAYRAFRTSLLLASASSPRVIVITSSFAREGKTTTAVNLATVLAQMGKPVLLIDADLRRPRLQKVFRGKMNLGLVNYLAANIALEDVIQETQVANLSVVLSGPTPPNPSELLGSDRMKHLIHEIRPRVRSEERRVG